VRRRRAEPLASSAVSASAMAVPAAIVGRRRHRPEIVVRSRSISHGSARLRSPLPQPQHLPRIHVFYQLLVPGIHTRAPTTDRGTKPGVRVHAIVRWHFDSGNCGDTVPMSPSFANALGITWKPRVQLLSVFSSTSPRHLIPWSPPGPRRSTYKPTSTVHHHGSCPPMTTSDLSKARRTLCSWILIPPRLVMIVRSMRTASPIHPSLSTPTSKHGSS